MSRDSSKSYHQGRDDGFSDGVIFALAVLCGFGNMGSTEYEQILMEAGRDRVIKRARETGTMRWSGLDRYVRYLGKQP
jgi:hypothetical protein